MGALQIPPGKFSLDVGDLRFVGKVKVSPANPRVQRQFPDPRLSASERSPASKCPKPGFPLLVQTKPYQNGGLGSLEEHVFFLPQILQHSMRALPLFSSKTVGQAILGKVIKWSRGDGSKVLLFPCSMRICSPVRPLTSCGPRPGFSCGSKILWMQEVLHHLRMPGMMTPPAPLLQGVNSGGG